MNGATVAVVSSALATPSNTAAAANDPDIDCVLLGRPMRHSRLTFGPAMWCSVQSIPVDLYLNGPAGSGIGMGPTTSEAVAQACQSTGTAYRFVSPLASLIGKCQGVTSIEKSTCI